MVKVHYCVWKNAPSCDSLRLLTESLILIGSAMLGATFNLVTRVETNVIFRTLKDGSLESNSLTLDNWLSD